MIGNTTEMCGGGYRVSLYDTKAARVSTTLVNQPGLVGKRPVDYCLAHRCRELTAIRSLPPP